MPTVEKRHLIRKRSQERSEIKIVEKSKLYQEAIKEVMNNRAEIVRCYKLIRQQQSAITIMQAALDNREQHDQENNPAPAQIIEARSQESAIASAEE